MYGMFTTGTWTVREEKVQDFVEAWAAFAGWASSRAGAGTLTLSRDVGSAERFVSFGGWESEEQVRAWKSTPEFREGIARVLQHVEGFEPTELTVVATAFSGDTTISDAGLTREQPASAV